MRSFSAFNMSMGSLFTAKAVHLLLNRLGHPMEEDFLGTNLPYFASLDHLQTKYMAAEPSSSVNTVDLNVVIQAIEIYDTLITNLFYLFRPGMEKIWERGMLPIAKPFHDGGEIEQFLYAMTNELKPVNAAFLVQLLHAFHNSLTHYTQLIAVIPGFVSFATTVLDIDAFKVGSYDCIKGLKRRGIPSLLRENDKRRILDKCFIIADFQYFFGGVKSKPEHFYKSLQDKACAALIQANGEYRAFEKTRELPVLMKVMESCDANRPEMIHVLTRPRLTPPTSKQFKEAFTCLHRLLIVWSQMDVSPVHKKSIKAALESLDSAYASFKFNDSYVAFEELIKAASGFKLIMPSLPLHLIDAYRQLYNAQGEPMVSAKRILGFIGKATKINPQATAIKTPYGVVMFVSPSSLLHTPVVMAQPVPAWAVDAKAAASGQSSIPLAVPIDPVTGLPMASAEAWEADPAALKVSSGGGGGAANDDPCDDNEGQLAAQQVVTGAANNSEAIVQGIPVASTLSSADSVQQAADHAGYPTAVPTRQPSQQVGMVNAYDGPRQTAAERRAELAEIRQQLEEIGVLMPQKPVAAKQSQSSSALCGQSAACASAANPSATSAAKQSAASAARVPVLQ